MRFCGSLYENLWLGFVPSHRVCVIKIRDYEGLFRPLIGYQRFFEEIIRDTLGTLYKLFRNTLGTLYKLFRELDSLLRVCKKLLSSLFRLSLETITINLQLSSSVPSLYPHFAYSNQTGEKQLCTSNVIGSSACEPSLAIQKQPRGSACCSTSSSRRQTHRTNQNAKACSKWRLGS